MLKSMSFVEDNRLDFLEKVSRNRKVSRKKVFNLIEKLHPYQPSKKLIRIGAKFDGGYLVPDDLEGVKACFSPGVDKVSEFEKDCINDYEMDVYMADKSVDKPNLDLHDGRYNFIKKFIGCTNNDSFITMDHWVTSNSLSSDIDLLLQMDIEGGEYSTIINMSDSLMNRFRIMTIEFHFLDDLWNPAFFDIAETVFDKILQTHSCVHIHPNNHESIYSRFGIKIPKVVEFTFLRNDRDEFRTYATQFPHDLDSNNSQKKPIILPNNWYKN